MENIGGSMDNASASSSASGGNCSAELMAQFPDCKTCLYSCNDGEEKQCAFGLPGNCSPTCNTFGTGGINMQMCTIPSSGSNNMSGDSNMDPSSANVQKMGIASLAAGAVWAVGYIVMM